MGAIVAGIIETTGVPMIRKILIQGILATAVIAGLAAGYAFVAAPASMQMAFTERSHDD